MSTSEKTFKIVNGDISDGYHTFDELYEHRCLLYLIWLHSCDKLPIRNCYWVRDHHDGWDLVVAHLHRWKDGQMESDQISYHVPAKYRKAYEPWMEEKSGVEHTYDGHTPQDVLQRLEKYFA